jgi:hypothetical protein
MITRKLVDGRRVAVPADLRELVPAEYRLLSDGESIIIAAITTSLDEVQDWGVRKLYNNAGKPWIVLPQGLRLAFGLQRGDNVLIYRGNMAGETVVIIRRQQ